MTTDTGPISRWLIDDHTRLEALLARSDVGGAIDTASYEEFRSGLLRHIGIEEKIVLPAAKRVRGGEPLEAAARLRVEHGALTSLLVPTPTPEIVAELRGLLGRHNPIEEGPAGVYAECDRLLAGEAAEIIARMVAAPVVRTMPHFDGHGVHRTAAEALESAAGSQARLRRRKED